MKLSWRGANLIKEFEALRLKAYAATAEERERGIWTIGWGHTAGVKGGDTCTLAQATEWFDEDVAEFEAGVNALVTAPITQAMFDALVSFAYNVGLDQDEDTKAEGLGDSTLLKLLNEGRYTDAANQFQFWNKQAGEALDGLTRRRRAEYDLFCSQPVVKNDPRTPDSVA